MWEKPLVQHLVGGRLHLQHGPIDVVLKAWGADEEVEVAYEAAVARFDTILLELTGELDSLRQPMSDAPFVVTSVARRMLRACEVFPDHFVTPMAAVAGAVADELIEVMVREARLDKAFVNDGGDVALHLEEGQSLTIGVMGDFSRSAIPEASARIALGAAQPVRGIATSGAQGRSFSLGICDSVTVLAANAAVADAAATLIANAVNIEHPRIVRRPAHELDPDNELAHRLVTVLVPPLGEAEIGRALNLGLEVAAEFRQRGLIIDAALTLQGHSVSLDALPHLVTGLKQ